MQITSNSEYRDQNFKSVVQNNQMFSSIEFDNIKFISCDFSESIFQDCKFIDCSFHLCNLSLVKLINTSLFEIQFKKCKLSGVDFSKLVGISKTFDFEECDLNYSNFIQLELQKRKFVKCTIREANFIEIKLNEADFTASDLYKTIFESCDLRKANFINAKNYFIDSTKNKINKAKFKLPEVEALLQNLDIEIVD